MAWYAAAGEECPWNATLEREGVGLLRWEDTVKTRCSCREYAGLQRGGRERESEGESWREEEKKRKKERRSDALRWLELLVQA